MTIIDSLKAIVGPKNLLTTDEEKAYARIDQSTNVPESLPLLVAKVGSVAELIEVVQCCVRHRQPLVVRAAGTGKSGGAVADQKTVVVDTTGLNRIINIDSQNLTAEVEPGVVLHEFQTAVSNVGLFYPPDPASFRLCTIGGNVAENAAGPSSLKYGSTKDYVLGGQAILGTGEIIEFGKRCPKGVAGYDIASLLCGSEGTLAVFTRLRLRLLPKPKSQNIAWYYFSDEKQGLLAVNDLLCHGHLPRTLEYVDAHSLAALYQSPGFSLKPISAKSALIIECDASYEHGAKNAMSAIRQTLSRYPLVSVLEANSEELRRQIWQARSMLSEASSRFLGFKISEDIAVPLGALLDFQEAIKKLEQPPHLLCGLFGHAGDGNLHVQIMFDDLALRSLAEKVRHEVLMQVLRLGGTLAAEHGIGLQKKAYLPHEQSAELIALQKRVKLAFDPYNLLNPGKIFDT
ncbi:MAG TPA: FAD-binding oxidoreductase [Myxococcota bacterium]|nr:FAD-binding oxidoreductase [Myxococcota bacterium]